MDIRYFLQNVSHTHAAVPAPDERLHVLREGLQRENADIIEAFLSVLSAPKEADIHELCLVLKHFLMKEPERNSDFIDKVSSALGFKMVDASPQQILNSVEELKSVDHPLPLFYSGIHSALFNRGIVKNTEHTATDGDLAEHQAFFEEVLKEANRKLREHNESK